MNYMRRTVTAPRQRRAACKNVWTGANPFLPPALKVNKYFQRTEQSVDTLTTAALRPLGARLGIADTARRGLNAADGQCGLLIAHDSVLLKCRDRFSAGVKNGFCATRIPHIEKLQAARL